jgi:hypothetical protein
MVLGFLSAAFLTALQRFRKRKGGNAAFRPDCAGNFLDLF